MSFAELNRLQSQLEALRNKLSLYKKELLIQKKRKQDVSEIANNMKQVCNMGNDEINGCLRRVSSELQESISGVRSVYSLFDKITSDKEKGLELDRNISQAFIYANNELVAVEHKIDQLELKIDQTKVQIENCKQAIRNEQFNIASDFLMKYRNASNVYEVFKNKLSKDPDNYDLQMKADQAQRNMDACRSDYSRYADWL